MSKINEINKMYLHISILLALIAQSIAVIEVRKCCGFSEDYDSSLDKCVPKKPDHDFFMKQPVVINLGAEATLQTNPVNDSLHIKFNNCKGNLIGYDYEVNEKGQLFTYKNESDELSEPRFYNDFCLDYSHLTKKIYKVCDNYMEIHKCCNTSQELAKLAEYNYTCVDRNKSTPLIDIGDFFKFEGLRKPNLKFVIIDFIQQPGVVIDILVEGLKFEKKDGITFLISDFEYCFDKLDGDWIVYTSKNSPAQAQVSFTTFPVVLSILCLVITFVIFCKKDFMKHPYMIILQFLVVCTTMEMICILIGQFYTSEYFVTFIQDCFLVLSCCSLTLIWLVISTKHKGFSGSDIVITSLIIVYYIAFFILRYNSYSSSEGSEKNLDFDPRTLVFMFDLFAYIMIANFHKWLKINLDNKLMKMDHVKKYFYGW
jgi:hypothetical protein